MESEDKQSSFFVKLLKQEDFKKFEFLIKKICIYSAPGIKAIFDHVKTLGKGGQAIVNLYKLKGTETDEKLFAIKSYKIQHPDMYK